MEMQMEMSYVFAVVFTGLIVVFIGLILLIAFIKVIGFIFTTINNKNKTAVKQPEVTPSNQIDTSVPIDDDEIIAVISAAVAIMSNNDNTTYKIKSVKAVNNVCHSRSAWAIAGLNESTSPF